MNEKKKYCKHCGELIDDDCVVCPKCGKQVEQLTSNSRDIIINNSASSSASSAASSGTPYIKRKMPWYLSWFWILILGACSGGIYWIVGIVMRVNWKSHN